MNTITGNFESLTGVGNGYVTATLAGYGNDVPRIASTGVLVNPITVSLPGTSFSLTVYGNDQVTPSGTYYILSFYDAQGNFVSSAAYSFVGGATYDLSTTAPIMATPATPTLLPSVDWSNITNIPALATLDSPTFTTKVLLPDGTQAAPALATASDSGTGFYKISAGNLGFTGTSFRCVNSSAAIWCTDAAATQNKVYITANTGVGLGLSSDNKLVWRNTTVFTSGTEDIALLRDGAGILAHRSGTQNQQIYLYNTYTDAANYERLQIGGATAGTNAFIRMQAAGTGVIRGLGIGFGASNDYFLTSGGLTLASGHTLRFGPTADATAAADTGLYRSAAGTLTLGNNTANDTSGSLIARNHTVSASGTATSGANFSSGSYKILGSYWDGAAAQTDTWTLTNSVLAGANPSVTLTLAHSGSTTSPLFQVGGPASGTSFTNYGPLTALTPTDATSGANVTSPVVQLIGSYWDGAASQKDRWQISDVLGTGANPTSDLYHIHTGSTGVANMRIGQAGGPSHGLVVYGAATVVTPTSATSGANSNSPLAVIQGRYWDGTQSQIDTWNIGTQFGAGANPASQLFFSHGGSTGTPSLCVPAITNSTGSAALSSSGIGIGTGASLRFTSGTSWLNAADAGLSRTATGTIAVGNGTSGDTSGKMIASNLTNVVAKVLLTGQTAAIASTTLYTPAAAGTYRVSVASYCTTAGTAGTMDVQIAASNGTFAQTYAYSITSVGGGGVQSLSGQSYRTLSVIAHVGAGQPINYSTVWSGVTGTPAYGLDIVVEQLQ